MSLDALIFDPAIEPAPLTRAQYDALVEIGALDGQPVELLEGWLITMNPQGPEHGHLIERLTSVLIVGLYLQHGDAYRVRPQLPLIASDRSEPEPDLCVIDAEASNRTHHPERAHLVIEAAYSSQGKDLVHKARIYAEGGFPEYWVVDIPRRETVVHRDPHAGPDPAYADVTRVPFEATLTVLGVDVCIADLDR